MSDETGIGRSVGVPSSAPTGVRRVCSKPYVVVLSPQFTGEQAVCSRGGGHAQVAYAAVQPEAHRGGQLQGLTNHGGVR